MAKFRRAASAREDAVTAPTTKDKLRAWKRWLEFLDAIELEDDDFLEDFDCAAKQVLIAAFAQSVRDAEYSTAAFTSLAAGTVQAAVNYVAQTFIDHFKGDPRKDESGATSRLLSQQYRGYKNTDPPAKQQKAVTCSILREMGKHTSTLKDLATAQLSSGAFFFAMRSCEYTKVTAKAEDRRTKLLCLRNLRFFYRQTELHHSDPRLAQADCVTITFEFQKNDERNDSVTMHRTSDNYLCPVLAWASVVARILSYPNTGPDSSVNMMYDSSTSRFTHLTSDDVRMRIRAAATVLGEAKLGFKPEDVGTHSLRSGAAMAMYLAHVPVYTIMIVGRWSSDAFLRYIRKQVEMFSHNVSCRMLEHEHFFTTPDFTSRDTSEPDNFATTVNMGGVGSQGRGRMSASFSLHT